MPTYCLSKEVGTSTHQSLEAPLQGKDMSPHTPVPWVSGPTCHCQLGTRRLAVPGMGRKGLKAERLMALGARWPTAWAPPSAGAATSMCVWQSRPQSLPLLLGATQPSTQEEVAQSKSSINTGHAPIPVCHMAQSPLPLLELITPQCWKQTHKRENLDKEISLKQKGISKCSLTLSKHTSTKWLRVAPPYIPDTELYLPLTWDLSRSKVHNLSRLANRPEG
jgi:hypothetical protein